MVTSTDICGIWIGVTFLMLILVLEINIFYSKDYVCHMIMLRKAFKSIVLYHLPGSHMHYLLSDNKGCITDKHLSACETFMSEERYLNMLHFLPCKQCL